MTDQATAPPDFDFSDTPPEPPSDPVGRKEPRQPSRAPRKASSREIEESLEELFGVYAMYLQMSKGDAFCAAYVLEHCETPARAWAKLAEKNETVNRILSMFVGSAGAWVEAATATVGFILPMMAHHGRIPPEVAMMVSGVEVPEVITPRPSPFNKRKRKTAPSPTRSAENTEEGATVIATETPSDPWSGVPAGGDNGQG